MQAATRPHIGRGHREAVLSPTLMTAQEALPQKANKAYKETRPAPTVAVSLLLVKQPPSRFGVASNVNDFRLPEVR